jgi:hypothetical protein
MKNYLALIVLSLFVVSCNQDDDMEVQNQSVIVEDYQNERPVANDPQFYQDPDMDVENGDDPPPKQVGGNGAKPAPTQGEFIRN